VTARDTFKQPFLIPSNAATIKNWNRSRPSDLHICFIVPFNNAQAAFSKSWPSSWTTKNPLLKKMATPSHYRK
jgi:hypothetical protein